MAKSCIPIPALSEKDKRRFFSKVSTIPTENGCLEWRASCNNKGYGHFGLGGRNGSKFLAHRIAYFLATGIDPEQNCVLHKCDNTKCCEGTHFRLGTHAENMADMAQKGRSGSHSRPESRPRGDGHWKSKLTADDIPVIRADTRTLHVIAAEYGVAFTLIHKIKNRQVWKHVA